VEDATKLRHLPRQYPPQCTQRHSPWTVFCRKPKCPHTTPKKHTPQPHPKAARCAKGLSAFPQRSKMLLTLVNSSSI
jgi:hypothetical protein